MINIMASVLADANRRFYAEILNMIDKPVKVTMKDGTTYQGTLLGVDSSLNIVLANAMNNKNERFSRVVIMSHAINEIALLQEVLDMREFAKFLEKYFPGMVKYIEEANIIQVGSGVKVTPGGVEGSGPLAKRVKELFDEFFKKR